MAGNALEDEPVDHVRWSEVPVDTVRKVSVARYGRSKKQGPHFAASVGARMTAKEINEMNQHKREDGCFLGH